MRAGERGFVSAVWAVLRSPVPPDYRGWLRFGWLLLLLFLVQVVTGTLLSFYYQPAPLEAALSTKSIMRDVSWGWLARGLHHGAAQGMIVLGILQLVRVTIQRSWRWPTSGSWYIGLALLALSVVLAFTGGLLTWDHDAYWSVSRAIQRLEALPLVGHYLAPMVRGGDEIGATTLSRLYSMHALVLPWLVFLLVLANLWLLARRARWRGRP
ncbi:MAG TPA: cytochrome b N-terminal domain-containing protein [Planctomycetota bacterium]|nr:cytochrome b N-terminal domain-containing protein [Planctomycetota bacterium]